MRYLIDRLDAGELRPLINCRLDFLAHEILEAHGFVEKWC